MTNVRTPFTDGRTDVSHALDLRPLLGEIARKWQRIHPLDLTAPETLRLLSLLTEVVDRLEGDQ